MSSKHYHIAQRDLLIAVENLENFGDAGTVDDARSGGLIVGVVIRYARFDLHRQLTGRNLQRASHLV